ncbi:MAG TPA: LemA family protein [Bacteroidales bacterium]|nr:LemA family protein [Bacteroidales bacterium]
MVWGTPILIIIILISIWGVRIYNRSVEKDEVVKKQWSQVETAYQRRYDLIDNLVNVVKGYAEFEKSTLTAVIEARSKATSIEINADDLSEENVAKYQAAQDELSGSLSRLMVVVEQYPNLKADQQFANLAAELQNTENMIMAARMAYNETVKDFNAYIRKFPRNLFAKMFGFKQYGYFKADEAAAKKVDVSF